MLRLLVSVGCALTPFLFLRWLERRTRPFNAAPELRPIALALVGFVLGSAAFFGERLVLPLLGLSYDPETAGTREALLVMLLFVAPLEEGLKLLVVWPLHARHRLHSAVSGISAAVAAAAGFAAAEASLFVWFGFDGENVLRALLGIPAELFFAFVWGYALGSPSVERTKWFSAVWLATTLVHGAFDYVVYGRGPGLLVLALPMLIAMALATFGTLRDVAPKGPTSSRRIAVLASMPEPPSMHELREALRRPDRPLFVHWIAIGSFVIIGVMIALFALAVYLGRRAGLDFTLANEGDFRSSSPLVLLCVAVLAAFPCGAYLVARASAATTVLEPAIAAALTIALLLFVTSATAPVGIVFALAMAPAAFALACAGAWFGRSR